MSPYPGGRWEPGPAAYGADVRTGVSIRMDDGVVLRATVAYPTDRASGRRAAGRFPVVIEHSVYPEAVGFGSGPVDTYFTEHGYISVHVNSRGTGGSGGVGQFVSPREARDGAAVVRWAARDLDGTDGRVAEVGCSWPGMQALADAAAVGPGSPLKAVVAACAGMSTVQRMDVLVSGVPTADFGFLNSAADSLMDANQQTRDWYHALSDEVLAGGDAAYERSFWQQRIPIDSARQIVDNQVPVLLWTGWHDVVGLGALRGYTALQNAVANRPVYAPMTPDQRPDPRYQLFVGDWGHAEGLDQGVALQWLDTWVKDADTGLQRTTTPLKLSEVGSDRWLKTAAYPTVDRYTRLLLGGGGTLTSASTAWGVDTIRWGDPSGLTYTSEPQPEATTLSGPVSLTVYAASTNRNLQLAARLYDVAPDGTADEITHGSIIGSLRDTDPGKSWFDSSGTPTWPWQTLQGDSYLQPGQTTRLDLVLEPRQWSGPAGHRLRLELTTQAGVALTAPQQASVPGATYQIQLGRSALNVPLQSPTELPEARCSVTPTSRGTCVPSD
ncbi:PepX_C domain-containing protein [Frankia sp. Hr75.2]|nr:PepX_C domain-containing protein [Frankia sp. Hr75.2]